MPDSERRQFRDFVSAQSGRLFQVALALTGGQHATAEDLLQSALVRTFSRWRYINDDPVAYVRQAMYHAQVSVWRRRLKELPAEQVPEQRHQRDDISEVDQRLAVRRALLRLGPRQRAVLVARFFEDLSELQTAQLLGCSVGTVRSQTYRALLRLRELAPELRDDDVNLEALR